MPEYITINGVNVPKGKNLRINLNIARLPTGTVIEIPVFIYRSKNDGPTILLLAGMHGDEVTGVEVIRRLITQKKITPTAGSVIAIPILNIYGFINFSRDVSAGKDVNRSFPGNKLGSLASRVAYHFMNEIFPHIQYGIDFHAGGGNIYNYPQVRCRFDGGINEELAKAFAAPFTMNAGLRPGSLRHAAEKRKIPIIVYEGGESLRMDEFSITEGMEGTLRLMKHLGMMDHADPPRGTIVIEERNWMRAKVSGIFTPVVKNATGITKNQLMGVITDPYGEYESAVKAPYNGCLIATNYKPVVSQGDALFHIGKSRENILT